MDKKRREPGVRSQMTASLLSAAEVSARTPYIISAESLTQYPELIPFEGFDPTNPEHLDPATGLPIPNTITLRDAATESEISPGSLYASGLIAAGGIVGLLGVVVKLYENFADRTIPRFSETNPLHHDWVSVLAFAALAFSLFYFARKPLAEDSSNTNDL